AFIPVIANQGDDAQVAKWLTAAKRHAIIGCYAQTELSHGSNVVGLQTTATFDEATDEFIINSPDITAAKWWIGSLGIAATHAVVQAQLIIKGKNFGPHIFITPIRSPVDFKPVKGVTVGDIGPKAYGGFSTTDNGCDTDVLFDHVRIPRDHMLMRFAKVSRSGEYTAPIHSKLSYGSMVNLRVSIGLDAGWRLAKATTIAVRYCTARRQFNPSGPDNLESQVISYSSVKHRLMPLISFSYALIVGSQSLSAEYKLMTEQLSRRDASMLPEMHVTSCALKVWASRRGSEGIEECRKAMGGHGYSVFSGISEDFANFVPANTYEGDNYVLCQQVGRALLKELGRLAAEEPITLKSGEYLAFLRKDVSSTIPLDTPNALLDPTIQLKILGTRAARLVAALGKKIQAGRAWQDVNMDSWEICFAHAEYHLLHQLVNKTRETQCSRQHAQLAPVFKSLTDLVSKLLLHTPIHTLRHRSCLAVLPFFGINVCPPDATHYPHHRRHGLRSDRGTLQECLGPIRWRRHWLDRRFWFHRH
ncbi:acyl-CoA dehydrogenase/oxidase C-terminal, partial [Dichotomocladium elegans]